MLPAIAKEPRKWERPDLLNNRPWFMTAPSALVGGHRVALTWRELARIDAHHRAFGFEHGQNGAGRVSIDAGVLQCEPDDG